MTKFDSLAITAMTENTDYDLYTYESQPYADSRPEHCALIARLRGFSPPALESIRCLEIGCASGNNILPLAVLHPASTFVGIDSASSQIARAEELKAKLSLTNIEFRHAQFEQFGSELGTFDYISPEQARDPRAADVRSDIYSLGCTLYFMLVGKPPFPVGSALQKLLRHNGVDPPDVRLFRPELPPAIGPLLGKMLAKRPVQRQQSAEELVAEIERMARDLGYDIGSSAVDLTLAHGTPRPAWMNWAATRAPPPRRWTRCRPWCRARSPKVAPSPCRASARLPAAPVPSVRSAIRRPRK